MTSVSADTESTMSVPAGTRGRTSDFEIGPILGEGGMAIVYEAVHKPTGKVVALKLFRADPNQDKTFFERFIREAKATATLKNEHICEVISVGDDPNDLFIAFECLKGGSVKDLKKSLGNKVPVEVATIVMAELLEALAVAHDAGIVHRDLKAANMLISEQGVIKLADFGIARTTGDVTLTATGMIVGTPAFMSPEQVEGAELDGRSDLFSVGLVLHDLLLGRSPFFHENPGTALAKVLREEVPLLYEPVPGVPTQLLELHAALTIKKRDKRVQNAREALAMIADLVAQTRRDFPDLIKRCLAAPEDMRKLMISVRSNNEVKRGAALQKAHGNIPAVILAYQNALAINPENEDALARLTGLNAASPKQDQRIVDAEAELALNPSNPGVLKRLADLNRAANNMRASAGYLLRYLRYKEDQAARQQLMALLSGPGNQNQDTMPKLQTADIMAGIKTGGNIKAPEREQHTLKMSLQTPGPMRSPVSPQGDHKPKPMVRTFVPEGTSSMPSVQIADGGKMASIAGIIGFIVLAAFIGRETYGCLTKSADKATAQAIQGQDIDIENREWGEVIKTLDAAEMAWSRRDGPGTERNASAVLNMDPPKKYWERAMLLRAQARIHLRDFGGAKADLDILDAKMKVHDPRHEEIAQILADMERKKLGR